MRERVLACVIFSLQKQLSPPLALSVSLCCCKSERKGRYVPCTRSCVKKKVCAEKERARRRARQALLPLSLSFAADVAAVTVSAEKSRHSPSDRKRERDMQASTHASSRLLRHFKVNSRARTAAAVAVPASLETAKADCVPSKLPKGKREGERRREKQRHRQEGGFPTSG